MNYTIHYFITKFTAIPEDRWCTGFSRNREGQCCAYGHCQSIPNIATNESRALCKFLDGRVASINDGFDFDTIEDSTPKQRILAALQDKLND